MAFQAVRSDQCFDVPAFHRVQGCVDHERCVRILGRHVPDLGYFVALDAATTAVACHELGKRTNHRVLPFPRLIPVHIPNNEIALDAQSLSGISFVDLEELLQVYAMGDHVVVLNVA